MDTHHTLIIAPDYPLSVIGLGKFTQISLSDESKKAIVKCFSVLQEMIDSGGIYYGINTGFGSLCDVKIPSSELTTLQENLIKSHACGVGAYVPQDVIRLMLLLKIKSLSLGYSGVHLNTVQRLVDMFNHNILPVIYDTGSLGASGDLAPLAHLSLPLIGEGEVWYQDEILPAQFVLDNMGWKPLKLHAKEGLALLNGTQFMSAYAVWLCNQSNQSFNQANLIASLSLDVYKGRLEPFYAPLHQIRPHNGQIKVSQDVLQYLDGSQLAQSDKIQIQDPYAFRCIPQVHGATYDTLQYVISVVETEINSVTDNPTIFPEEQRIVSGGNFHGQPLALVMDFLAIAMAELGSISERRIYNLIHNEYLKKGLADADRLPAYLTANGGVESGLMILQYTAASLVSKNKQLCTPASVDSIPSSNGQEDHVSMGANSATKCYQLLDNLSFVLAIEWMNACQALEFRRPLTTSPALEKVVNIYRENYPFHKKDIVQYPNIQGTKAWINNNLI